MYKKVIIIGAGPSGISAAIYLKRANVDFLLIEKYMVGGKLPTLSSIENYLGFKKENGFDLALKMQDQLKFNQIDVCYDNIVEINKEQETFILKGKKEEYTCSYLVLAIGTNEKHLNLTNEDKYLYKGISFCAVCDGSLYRNKPVAVLGGNMTSLEETMYLSSICSKVYLVSKNQTFNNNLIYQELVKKENVEILHPYEIVEYIGSTHLDGIKIKSLISNELKEINISCLFMYLGYIANIDFVNFPIENENGFVIVNEVNESSIKNLFAIGDIKKKNLRQVVTAASDGAITALEISKRVKR